MYDDKEPEACHTLLGEGWTYLDVRTPDEFRGGHPEGAVNVPFQVIGPGGMMPNPLFLGVVRALFPPSTPLVVGGATGSRSSRACQMLAQMGYGSLVHVIGGFSGSIDAAGQVETVGWRASGLPVAEGRDEGSWDAVQARLRA